MSAAEHLGTYAKGWSNGDAEAIVRAASDDYTFDDPNSGVIRKQDITRYLAELKDTVKRLRGGSLPTPFMELSEVTTREPMAC